MKDNKISLVTWRCAVKKMNSEPNDQIRFETFLFFMGGIVGFLIAFWIFV